MNRPVRNIANMSLAFAMLTVSLSSANAQDARTARLTPFSKVDEDTTTGAKIPINTYTRLEVTSSDRNEQVIDYAKRNLFFRIAIGKTYTSNVILNSEAGQFKATIPLIAREYNSSSKTGEAFVREITYDAFKFPLFLVSSDSRSQVGNFVLSVDMAEANDSNVASLSLDVISKAIEAVAPTSGVVTALTKESTDDVANTLDSVASQMTATSVREKTSFDLKLDQGTRYILSVYGPTFESDELKRDRLIGQWTIEFAEPRPSIFSDITCTVNRSDKCASSDPAMTPRQEAYDQATANPSNVLAYELVDKVGDLGTIAAYLKQQDWWSESLAALDEESPAYARFCRRIRNSIAEIGLNDLDGRIVANAVARSSLVSDAISAGLLNEPDCKYN